MKILELQLLAFGPFTDVFLEFAGESPGMYIIFGPNEAGKSSALRALTALLFGINHNSPDNFIHDYQQLRIGGKIRNAAGCELGFLRRKGRSNTLLTPEGVPLDDAVLEGYLHSVDKQLFLSVLGIDHDSLVSGGEDILKGGGEVGQSLFAAGLGTADLRGFIKELEDEAKSLFLARGQNQVINQAVSDYQATKKFILENSLASRAWLEQDQASRDARLKMARVTQDLRALSSEKVRLERLAQVLPKIGKRDGLATRQKDLGDVIVLGPDFTEARREAVGKLKAAQESLERASGEMEHLQEELKELIVPQALLHQSPTITALHQRLGAHLKATKDLPGLQGTLQQLEADTASIMADLYPDLSLAEAGSIRLPAAQRIHIQDLGGQYQALVESVSRSGKRINKAQQAMGETKDKRDAIIDRGDPVRLKQTIDRAKSRGNIEEIYHKILTDLKIASQQAEVDLKKLGLWTGTLEDLETLSVPVDETVDRFEAEMLELASSFDSLGERINDQQSGVSEVDRHLAELRLRGEVPSEDELVSARERRDYGWKLVRLEWLEKQDMALEKRSYDPDQDLPEAYERSVISADQVGDRLRREAERVATQAALVAEHTKLEMSLKNLKEHKTKVEEGLAKLQEEWRELWALTGIDPLPPKEMRSWITRQKEMVRLSENVRVLKLEADRLQGQISEHIAELGQELEHLGEPKPTPGETLEKLLIRCQELVDIIQESARDKKELGKKVGEINNEVKEARQEKSDANHKLEEWQAQWLRAIKPLGLTGEVSPAAVHLVITKLDELFKKLDEAASLKSRIEGITRDAQQFGDDVLALITRLAPDLAKMPAAQAAAELQARLTQAQTDEATATALRKQTKEKDKVIQEAEETIRLMEDSLADLCRQAGCGHFDELEAMELRSKEYQDLQKAIGDIEEQIFELSPRTTLEEIRREAEIANADELPERIKEIARQIQELEEERIALAGKIARAENELERMDGNPRAAEAAENLQGIASSIQDRVEQYLRLRMASVILRREIERYRVENQGPLLARGEELFNRLTLSSFSGLTTDFNEKDEPILLGVRPSGKRVRVEGMSKGTRDQLYLALRLASLEKYLEASEAMPFVVDDILINFDNRRAEATLEALARLSEKTQVLFFTHHVHLVELAQRVAGDGQVRVLNLPES